MTYENELKESQPGLHAEALPLIRDLFAPNPLIYWADFLFCTILGWLGFALTLQQPMYSLSQAFYFFLTSLSLYRSVIFIHEIAHFKPGTFPIFRLVWNLFIGFPLLVPSFSYTGVHLNHHKRSSYGKKEDGEYLPFVKMGRLFTLWFLFSSCLMPLILFLRCLILTPLTFIHPGLRRWSWKHLSSLAIDLEYERPEARPEEVISYRAQETATFLYWATFFVLSLKGIIPIQVVLLYYVMASFVFFLNSLRTLVAHRYRNSGDLPMTIDEQFLDSVDITGNNFSTTLWAPVGLRYHATHHLFPTIPYHNLAKVRRRLENKLVTNKSVYQKSLRPSLIVAFKELWYSAGRKEAMQPVVNDGAFRA